MPKPNHPEALRVYEAMRRLCAEPIAREAAFGYALSPDPSPEERMRWAKHLCNTLEQLGEDRVRNCRMACRCAQKWDNIHQAKELYRLSSSLDDFAATAREQLGVGWEARDDALFVTYSACSCPMVNQSPERLPVAWCYCTMGYNRDYFSEVFGVPVGVAIEKAIKLGDPICLMQVTRQPPGAAALLRS